MYIEENSQTQNSLFENSSIKKGSVKQCKDVVIKMVDSTQLDDRTISKTTRELPLENKKTRLQKFQRLALNSLNSFTNSKMCYCDIFKLCLKIMAALAVFTLIFIGGMYFIKFLVYIMVLFLSPNSHFQ